MKQLSADGGKDFLLAGCGVTLKMATRSDYKLVLIEWEDSHGVSAIGDGIRETVVTRLPVHPQP